MKTCRCSYDELEMMDMDDPNRCTTCGGRVVCAVCQEPGGDGDDLLVDACRDVEGEARIELAMLHGSCVEENDAWRMA